MDLQLGTDVSLKLGARRDDFKYSGIEDTGSLSGVYQLPVGAVYGLINKGFKAPSLYQSFDPQYGNAELKAEEGYSYELGYKLDRGIAFFDLAIFQNELQNLIGYRDAEPNFYNVAGLTTTRGAELIIGHVWTAHKLELAASYIDLTKNAEPLPGSAKPVFSRLHHVDCSLPMGAIRQLGRSAAKRLYRS